MSKNQLSFKRGPDSVLYPGRKYEGRGPDDDDDRRPGPGGKQNGNFETERRVL